MTTLARENNTREIFDPIIKTKGKFRIYLGQISFIIWIMLKVKLLGFLLFNMSLN